MSVESLAVLKGLHWSGSPPSPTNRSVWQRHDVADRQTVRLIPAYCVTALVIVPAFVFINRTIGEKLKGSDTFGKAEFYLAMPAGMLRFACIVLVFLALLNARYYTTAEVREMTKYQNDNYGSNFSHSFLNPG